MRVLFFGTFDRSRHPRVLVLMEGCRRRGDEVFECDVPLGDSTGKRVALLRRPWLAVGLLVRIMNAWGRLIWRARTVPTPDLVVVGYLGHLDVHLARRLWRGVPIALDHLISVADTAADRRSRGRLLQWALRAVDTAALRAADVAIVDTEEHRQLVPADLRTRAIVVDVGAPAAWFCRPVPRSTGRLRVVFFGLFTPLQGTVTIGEAIGELADSPIDFLMIGTGQDYDQARDCARGNPNVRWIDWTAAEELPRLVSGEDVCLGIFGTGQKALRVVPNKVYQGAAAGCAIVTSDTPPQRRALAEAAVFVPPGSARHLAAALVSLQRHPDRVWQLRMAGYGRACAQFSPEAVVEPLRSGWQRRSTKAAAEQGDDPQQNT
jgi:glycosyltransferase involved in cell wall biosynthesis